MDFLLSNLQQIGNALGWTLIHFIWQGIILVASYFTITRLFFKNKIHLHYWTGIFFIVLCLIIPIKEFAQQLQLSTDLNSITVQQFGANITLISSTGIFSPIDMLISLIHKAIPYLVVLWATVIVLISSSLTNSWFELVKLSKNNALKVPQNLLNTLEENSKILKLKFKPIISINSQVIIPATFGFFKPVILLPASLISQLPQEQMEAILLHELCHIKRSDFIHNILQLLVETLFFYNPFTRWMSADIRKIREQCCDKLVLKLETKPLLYAKALTNLAALFNQQNKGKTSYLQIAATDGELLNRIKILMLQKKNKSPLIYIISGVLLSLILLTLFKNLPQHSGIYFASNQNSYSSTFTKSILTGVENRPSYLIPNLVNLVNDEENKRKAKQQKLTHLDNVAKQKNKTVTLNTSIKSNKSIGSSATTLKPVQNLQKNFSNAPLVNQTTNVRSLETNVKMTNIKTPSQSKPLTNKFPKLIYRVNPIYSRNLRERGIEGSVILSFNINSKGRVKNIEVDKSSPLKLLDGNARLALKKWRFDKHTVNEQNIKNRYQQIFTFTLDGSNSCHNGDLGSLITTDKICQDL